jgi:hypothetical protein
MNEEDTLPTAKGRYCPGCQEFFVGQYNHCPYCGKQLGEATALITHLNMHGGSSREESNAGTKEVLQHLLRIDMKELSIAMDKSKNEQDPSDEKRDQWVIVMKRYRKEIEVLDTALKGLE